MKPAAVPGRSLRIRLLAGTLVWIVATIAIAGWVLAGLFRQHAAEQFRVGLESQLEQLTANLTIDQTGKVYLAAPLSDPRLSRPNSGLYWQIDPLDSTQTVTPPGALRSRSLWDYVLQVPDDTVADGEIHQHQVAGPGALPLEMIERMVYPAERPQQPLRLIVAADARLLTEPVDRFNGLLIWSLGMLGLGLVVAAVVQVVVGLRPLGDLRRALVEVHEGRVQSIEGAFPLEVQPLVSDFNEVLAHNARILNHARTQAGNLAHAVKTPLAILANAAACRDPQLPRLVSEQIALAQDRVDYHLARSRAAAATTVPGANCPVAPLVQSIIHVMERLHADRNLAVTVSDARSAPVFRGERQDLQEMLGNLLDNAWKWAATRIDISFQYDADWLTVLVDDDGPGLSPERRESVLARGVRADERMPGSGLGLAIVSDLVQLYGGSIVLDASPLGGLRLLLTLPAVRKRQRSH
ncbi:MAG: sensor histidine kinase [Chromatiaceae bacterium]|nr:sensor histidine kinase [Chromatiaceae bacterium]MCP5443317.1 sensor histidine kinase [Chromatiaceae bacterium]